MRSNCCEELCPCDWLITLATVQTCIGMFKVQLWYNSSSTSVCGSWWLRAAVSCSASASSSAIQTSLNRSSSAILAPVFSSSCVPPLPAEAPLGSGEGMAEAPATPASKHLCSRVYGHMLYDAELVLRPGACLDLLLCIPSLVSHQHAHIRFERILSSHYGH